MAAAALAFTPGQAALGGSLLGVSAASHVLLTGRILGISGAIKGLIHGDRAMWRIMLLSGMTLASIPLAKLMPEAFSFIPDSFLARAAIGGLLVGVGAAMGNGCTSGHGICGNARMSPRSLAYTLTFMAAGAAVATATGTLAALGVPAVAPQLAALPADQLRMGLTLAAASTAAALGLGAAGRKAKSPAVKSALDAGASFGLGALFSAGLAMSGMVQPAKVAGFLSPMSPAWDLSLMFVMGAAVLISFPAFQSVIGKLWRSPPWAATPALAPSYCLPPTTGRASVIDAKLIVGGVLFGAGWGLCGMCPGPAIVTAVATYNPSALTYVASLVAGIALEPAVSKALKFTPDNKPAAAEPPKQE